MTIEKNKRGRWKSGESGNPNGRPQGVGEVAKLRDSRCGSKLEVLPLHRLAEPPRV